MRLATAFGLLGLLATTCTADNLAVFGAYHNEHGYDPNRPLKGAFFTGFGTLLVPATAGCHYDQVPGMPEFCMDWRENRAHFVFDNQPRRCLQRQYSRQDDWCQGDRHCTFVIFEEVPCTW